MKKIIPTVFAMMLAISSVSLSVGCAEGVPVDPDADAKAAGQEVFDDSNFTAEEKKEAAGIEPPPATPPPGEKK